MIEPFLSLGKYGSYPDRSRDQFERLINRLKDWRGITTGFDKSPESYLAGLELRASMIWIEDPLRVAD